MKPLTPRQKEAMVFVQSYIEHHSIAPSYDEILVGLGLKSKHSVAKLVSALAQHGLIRVWPKHARGIVLLPTEQYHAPGCICLACGKARYLRALQSVHALQITPPIALTAKLSGLRPLDNITRLYWRAGFPKSEARSQARVQAVQ